MQVCFQDKDLAIKRRWPVTVRKKDGSAWMGSDRGRRQTAELLLTPGYYILF